MLVRMAAIFAAASGGFGGKNGDVIATARGTTYLRAKGVVNANMDARSIDARSRLTLASRAWASLSAANRDKWIAWATGHKRTNRMGMTGARSGFQEFVAYYTLMNRAGGTALTNFGPDFSNARPACELGTVTIDDLGDIDANLVAGSAIASTTGARILLEVSAPIQAQQNYFGDDYRYVASVTGSSTTPPTIIQSTDLLTIFPGRVNLGGKCQVRLSLVMPNGATAIMEPIQVTITHGS
jgi:hypothetical protein